MLDKRKDKIMEENTEETGVLKIGERTTATFRSPLKSGDISELTKTAAAIEAAQKNKGGLKQLEERSTEGKGPAGIQEQKLEPGTLLVGMGKASRAKTELPAKPPSVNIRQ